MVFGSCQYQRFQKKEAEVNFLKPAGPQTSFKFPSKANKLVVPFTDIMTSPDVKTKDGINYIIKKRDMDEANKIFKKLL